MRGSVWVSSCATAWTNRFNAAAILTAGLLLVKAKICPLHDSSTTYELRS